MNARETQVTGWIDSHAQDLYDLLCEMIRFDSQNFGGDGREREFAEYMAKLYRDLGLETEMFCPDSVPGLCESPLYWPGHNTDKRPNVVGVCRGQDGAGRVMLAAHTDTMPVGDESAWTKPPFGGIIEDGRIFGLGSGDNKASLAAAYFALKALKTAGIPCKKDVVLAAYCDEEFGGGNGALGVVMRQPCDDYCNLDGSGYEMWATALGGGLFRGDLELNRVTDDCTDISRALQLTIDALVPFGQKRRDELASSPYYAGTQNQRSAYRMVEFGNIPGSHTKAQVTFVIYTLSTRAQIEAELTQILKDLAPEFAKIGEISSSFVATTRFFDFGESDTVNGAFPVMKECAEEAAGHSVPVCGSCLTDLSAIMAQGGNRAFNFGIFRDFSLPGGAHQPDEYVECSQFLEYTRALALFLLRYCA